MPNPNQDPPDPTPEPDDQLQVLQAAAETLQTMEPADLDHWEVRAALDAIQEHSSQLIWARSLGRPEFRS